LRGSFAEVAVNLAVKGTFTYSIPQSMRGSIKAGSRVIVGFGKRNVSGFVISLTNDAPKDVNGIRPIIDVSPVGPVFDEKRLGFFKWLSSYYFSPLGPCLSLACPRQSRKKRRVAKDPLKGIRKKASHSEPNPEQRCAIDSILGSFKKGAFAAHLLYGVTGSGKTLVYLKVIEDVIESGRSSIVLVPEIALSYSITAYVMDRFPGIVAVWHSAMSPAQKEDEWGRILKGEARIVIGARSALFSPVKDLGIIIVDEEHDPSYKEEKGVRYNARDSAIMLAKHMAIPVVLGSATPSMETFHNARTGRFVLNAITRRVRGQVLPSTELVDMRGAKAGFISERLSGLIGEALDKGDQALVFQNRRGFANSILCRDCGYAYTCRNCAVALTSHKREGALKCHYCGFSLPLPEQCPKCHGPNLLGIGVGTEKVEAELRRLFPDARIARMDRDTTSKKGAAKVIMDDIEDKKVQILVGTQMVAKGHDFPGISVVGIISGDASLNIPDFRSAERTFHLISQAAGRAGRGDSAGRVVIQTLNPGHYCFQNAMRLDYEGFYREELALRKEALYPPFARLCAFRLTGRNERAVERAADVLKGLSEKALQKKALFPNSKGAIAVLGPSPAPLSRLMGMHRWHMLIKSRDAGTLRNFVNMVAEWFNAVDAKGVKATIDMDPATTI
jgi:primosomal protein N' (replication factor Y)